MNLPRPSSRVFSQLAGIESAAKIMTPERSIVRICLSFPLVAFFVVACAQVPPPPRVPELLRPATIKDIMDSMVNPSGDFVFESVQQIADEHGIRERAPQTNAEWEEVRSH